MVSQVLRRWFVVGAVAFLMAAVVGVGTPPAHADPTDVADEASYRAALAALSADVNGPHTITITADFVLDDGGDPSYTGGPALTIEGGGHTIDAGGTSRIIFQDGANVVLTINDLTLTGASRLTELGGAVGSDGPVVVTNSTFIANHAGAGGAVGSWESITVANSTFTANTAALDGGALASNEPITVTNSSFTANEAAQDFGAVGSNLVVSLTNSTLTDNVAGRRAGAAGSNNTLLSRQVTAVGNTAPDGANFRASALTIFASAVADPQGGGSNCSAPNPTTSEGYNWADDTSCQLIADGDVQDVGGDPRLGPLRDNGGSTPTMFPLWASPLRDAMAGDACSPVLATDQRGIARPYPSGGACDIGAVEAVYPPHGFGDVPAWVDTSIAWITSTVNDPALMTGITPTTFRPNDPITRAQMVRLLYREAGAPDVSSWPAHGFADVPPWVQDAVRWAKATDVMTGYPTNPPTFKPDDPITRAQVTRAKYRFAGEQDTTGYAHPFVDVAPWADQAVDWAWEHQLMTGISPTTFDPDDPITRAQVTRVDERLGLSPWAWADPEVAPGTLPFRPDHP